MIVWIVKTILEQIFIFAFGALVFAIGIAILGSWEKALTVIVIGLIGRDFLKSIKNE